MPELSASRASGESARQGRFIKLQPPASMALAAAAPDGQNDASAGSRRDDTRLCDERAFRTPVDISGVTQGTYDMRIRRILPSLLVLTIPAFAAQYTFELQPANTKVL